MKIVSTIEARMTSSRLPGKVLLEVLDKPMLEHLVNRLKRTPSIDQIVLATTVNKTDDVLVELAEKLGIACFRGSEENVMARVMGAAESVKADLIVEITGDCPLVDPNIVEQTIRMYQNNSCEYASNVGVLSYPTGFDAQVFALDTLKKSYSMTSDPLDYEHVTRHIRMHPEIFKTVTLVAGPEDHWPDLGIVLDEPKDYELLSKIFGHFKDRPYEVTCREVIHLLRDVHPEWLSVNEDVVRRRLDG
jgi:spore coat polysaccharide biosynthesis protein SpsF